MPSHATLTSAAGNLAAHAPASESCAGNIASGAEIRPILRLQRTLGNRRVRELIQARRLTPDGRILPVNAGSNGGAQVLQRQGAPAAAPQPPRYHRDAVAAAFDAPIPASHTVASVTAKLAERVTSHDLKGIPAVTGTVNDTEKIFLLYRLWQLGTRGNWNTEFDVVTSIGWPTGNPPRTPQGRVTIRIDSQGSAAAELIARGGVPQVRQTASVEDGVATLKRDFNVKAEGWPKMPPRGKMSNEEEISDVIAALTLLKSRAAADVAVLDGVKLIRVSTLAEIHAHSITAGLTTQEVDGQAKVELADVIFDNNAIQFFGGGAPDSPTQPATFEPILHEVGHLVEKAKLRATRRALTEATKQAVDAKKNREANSQKFQDEEQKAREEHKRLRHGFAKDQSDTYHRDEQAEKDAKAHQTAAEGDRANTFDPIDKSRTKRLQAFANLGVSPISPYSATYGIEEFYAEAYSLWLVDPEFVRHNYPAIYDFFHSGKHRV